MWKYTHTDEMYHSLTNNSDTLYHSDIYLGETYDDGLRHFKYIDKKMVNGKWKYYYKDDNLKKLGKERDKASEVMRYENKKRGYGNDGGIYYIAKGKEVKDPTYKVLSDYAWEKGFNYARAEYKSNKRKERYKPTVKGLNALSDASYAVGKKVRKGKKAVEKALNKISKKKKK